MNLFNIAIDNSKEEKKTTDDDEGDEVDTSQRVAQISKLLQENV
jgi:hypothetical protein